MINKLKLNIQEKDSEISQKKVIKKPNEEINDKEPSWWKEINEKIKLLK